MHVLHADEQKVGWYDGGGPAGETNARSATTAGLQFETLKELYMHVRATCLKLPENVLAKSV